MHLPKSILAGLLVTIFLFNCSSNDTSDDTSDIDQPVTTTDGEDLLASNTATDPDGNTYEVGFNQVSGINQDPFVRKRDASGESIWYIEHEKSEVDGRAVYVMVDDQDIPWVVFTLVGGSTSDDYITRRELKSPAAFENRYAGSYDMGGGPKVSIIAQLDPNTGKIEKGTFILAKKNDGTTNGFSIQAIGMKDGHIAFTANTAAWPPGEGSSYRRFPNITDEDRVDNVFKMYYEIDTDLTTITTAALCEE